MSDVKQTANAVAFYNDPKNSNQLKTQLSVFEYKGLSRTKTLGTLFDSAAMRIALTNFEGREAYAKSNNLFQLDIWDLETQRVLFSFEDAHKDRILSIVATSDAKFLISASADRTIAVWSLEKKVLHHRFEEVHKSLITALAVTKDNKYVISATQRNAIGVFSLEEKEKKYTIEEAHSETIWSLTTMPDSNHIVSTGTDGITSVWSISERTNVYRFASESSHAMSASAVTPDGKYVISASEDGCIFVWDFKLGTLSDSFLTEDSVGIRSLVVSSDSKRLYCGCRNGVLLVWSLEDRTKPLVYKTGGDKEYTSAICQLQFSTDNKYLVSTSKDGTIILWSLNQDKLTSKALDHAKANVSEYLYVTPDSKYLISATVKKVSIFSVEKRKLIGVFKERQDQKIHVVVPSLDSKKLFMATSDNTFTVLHLETLEIVDKISYEIGKDPQFCVMVTDGQNLIFACQTGKNISIVSLKEKKIIHQLPTLGTLSLCLSKDFKYLVSGSVDNIVTIWDYNEKKEPRHFSEPNQEWPVCMKFTQEGHLLILSIGGYFSLWNINNIDKIELIEKKFDPIQRRPAWNIFRLAGDELIYLTDDNDTLIESVILKEEEVDLPKVKKVSLNSPHNWLFTIGDDQKLLFIRTSKGIEVRSLPENKFEFEINLVTAYFSHSFQVPDSKSVIVITENNHLELWELEKGSLVHRFDRQNSSQITFVTTINQDNVRTLLLGTQDGSIEKCKLADKSLHSNSVKVHDDPILGLAITPDNKNLVSCSAKALKILDWTKIAELKEFELKEFELKEFELQKFQPGSKFEPENKDAPVNEAPDKNVSRFSAFAVSSDSQFMIVGQQDSMLLAYSIEKKKLIATVPKVDTQNGARVKNILITADCKRVIVSYANAIAVFAKEPGKLKLIRTLTQPNRELVTSLDTDIDNKRLFSSSNDGTIKVWNLETYKLITSFRHTKDPLPIDESVKDPALKKLKSEEPLEEIPVKSAKLSPDGKILVYSLDDNTINILNIKGLSGKTYKIPLSTGGSAVNHLIISPDKRYIITADNSRNIIVTDFYLKKKVHRFKDDLFSDFALKVAITADSKYIIGGSADKSVAVWDFKSRKPHHHFKQLHKGPISAIATFSDCKTIVTGSHDQSIAILDIPNKKVVLQFNHAHDGAVSKLLTTTIIGTTYVISTGEDSIIRIWEYENNALTLVRKYTDPQEKGIENLFLTADNQYIITKKGKSIKIWKFEQEETEAPFILKSEEFNKEFTNACLSNNGKYFAATSSADKSIRVWDILQNRLVCYIKEPRFERISKIKFTPDLKQLVYIINNETIEVMNCSFLSVDPEAHKDRIPLLTAIDCYCNPKLYSSAELSEGISTLAKWYYLPKGWNFLNYIAFLLPTVDKSMVDTAKINKISFSFDNEDKTQLDYLLEYKGKMKPDIRSFYAYFFKNVGSLVTVDMVDPSRLLQSLAENIERVQESQTESSFISYLSSFSLEITKENLKNSELLPIQGAIKNDSSIGFIPLSTLEYNQAEVEKTVIKGNLTLKYSLLALPGSYDIYSEDSLKLIGLLNDSENVSFYQSPTVRTVIDFYWEKTNRYLWYLLAFHIIPVGLFTAFAIVRNDDEEVASGLLAGVVTITSLLLFAEILQIISGFSEYVQNPFNFIEIIMLSIQIVNAVLFWIDPTTTAVNFFVSLSTILWYFKILILMRVIDQLRYLIRMIVQIITDIIAFLTVIFAMMMAITIAMYQSRRASGDDTTFWSVFLESYTLGIGNYDSSNYSGVTLPFFIFATLFMVLILMNMLIALMNDSFGSVKGSQVAVDAWEKIAMISEISSTAVQLSKIASLLSCSRRSKTTKKFYILYVEPFETSEEKASLQDLINTQNDKIVGLKDHISTVKVQIADARSELKGVNENLQKLVEPNKAPQEEVAKGEGVPGGENTGK